MSETLSTTITVRVPAKINIHLGVGPLRPDGFHELRTVFHAIDLFDVITARPAEGLSLTVHGPESAGLPADATNLAWRAAALLAAHAGIEAAVDLTVDKSIPIAAGLAGGSADAAGALLACNRLWGVNLRPGELADLATQLGSDVTFALHGRTALGAGRGEQLQDVEQTQPLHWVVVAADGGLSTPEVYRELDRQRAEGRALAPIGSPAAALAAIRRGDPTALRPHLGNDLEPAAIALAPYLCNTLAAGHDLGALAGIVSGSGPTCVFLTSTSEHAVRLADALQASGSCRFARAVCGGVAAAEVTS